MDIYTAESQIRKLLKYVEDIEERRPNMYQKSRKRLKDLAENCVQVVKVISSILQDETLQTDDSEFVASSSDGTYQMIQAMEAEVREMRDFLGYPQISSSSSGDTAQPDDEDFRLDRSLRLKIMNRYTTVLRSTASADIKYLEVKECAQLIWNWFDGRFRRFRSPMFHYNILNIKNWIVSIVVAYGHHHEEGSTELFVQEFNSWIVNLDSNSVHQYPVPVDINDIFKNLDKDEISLTSLVLWDMLRDCGYWELFESDIFEGAFPSETSLYDICTKNFPSSLDHYRDYRYDDSIIQLCVLTEVAPHEV